MRVLCSRDNLMEGITIVQKAVSAKSTLPILEGILIEATDRLKLTGNDLEMVIECFVEADVIKKGSIVLNSKMFGEIIRKMTDTELLLEVQDDEIVIIESDDTHFRIKGLSSEGYPTINPVSTYNTFTLSQILIKDMIKKTIFAIGSDDSLAILTGSLIEYKNRQLTFVSMDRARMAVCRSTINNVDSDFEIIVPGKTLNEIMKLLQPVDDEVVIVSTSNRIAFKMKDCIITSRLLEGEYINYRSMIPADYETKVIVNTKRLLLSLERAFLIASGEKMHPVKLSMLDEKMIISCATEFGEVNDELKVDMNGKIMNMAFNPALLISALRTIDDEKIELLFSTSRGPCIMKPISNDAFTYVIAGVHK